MSDHQDIAAPAPVVVSAPESGDGAPADTIHHARAERTVTGLDGKKHASIGIHSAELSNGFTVHMHTGADGRHVLYETDPSTGENVRQEYFLTEGEALRAWADVADNDAKAVVA